MKIKVFLRSFLLIINLSSLSYDVTHFNYFKEKHYCKGCNLENADLHGGDYTGNIPTFINESNLNRVNFNNSDLRGVRISNSNLVEANFTYAALSQGYITNSNFLNAKFNFADLNGIQIYGSPATHFEGANFYRAKINSAQLNNIKADNAVFEFAEVQDTSFRGASLRNTNFYGANLKNTDFRGADLSGADLRATKGLNTTGANITGAKLPNFNN